MIDNSGSLANTYRQVDECHRHYLKNAETLETISKVTTIIFDKTGTITASNKSNISYKGTDLTNDELKMVKTVLRASNHPLSRALYEFIKKNPLNEAPQNFEEVLGKGIVAELNGTSIKLGSANFVGETNVILNETAIYVKFNNEVKGNFVFQNSYRNGLKAVFEKLSLNYKLAILSGDNEGEKIFLEKELPNGMHFEFNQKPEDKLNYIKLLQQKGEKVMMIGDGLNDAGALAQSDIGISISEDVNVFSPACDAILDAKLFEKLPSFLNLSKSTLFVIKLSFIVSFCYNVIGTSIALAGNLTPIVAAILMPLSSITVVVFVTILTNLFAKKADI